jgi:hypothetical protein
MKLYLAFVNRMAYLTEAALEVFSPDHDTGVSRCLGEL